MKIKACIENESKIQLALDSVNGKASSYTFNIDYGALGLRCEIVLHCAFDFCQQYDKKTCSVLFHEILDEAFKIIDEENKIDLQKITNSTQ